MVDRGEAGRGTAPAGLGAQTRRSPHTCLLGVLRPRPPGVERVFGTFFPCKSQAWRVRRRLEGEAGAHARVTGGPVPERLRRGAPREAGGRRGAIPPAPPSRSAFGLCCPFHISSSLETLVACSFHSTHQFDLSSRVRPRSTLFCVNNAGGEAIDKLSPPRKWF